MNSLLPGDLAELLYSSMALRNRFTCSGLDDMPTSSMISLNSDSSASTSWFISSPPKILFKLFQPSSINYLKVKKSLKDFKANL